MGSGKNLCEELATEISSIKAVLGDATVRLPDALKAYTSFVASKTWAKIQEASLATETAPETNKFDELLSIKAKMEDLVKDFPHLTACDLESLVLVDNEETATIYSV